MATAAKFPAATLALADVGGEMGGFPNAVLSGAHNNSVATITLTATVPSYWPTAGWVTIDSEIITYTGKSGATLTGCTRGAQSAYSGSAAASHADQAQVWPALTPQQWNQVVADLIALETQWVQGADIASAGTTDLSTATGGYVHVTGTTTITAFGTLPAGRVRFVEFTGILTLTHNATSLILRSGANATTAAGDIYAFVSEGSGNWRELFHTTASAAVVVNNVSAMHLTDDFLFFLGTGASGTLFGGLGWVKTSSGGTTAQITTAIANHPGILEMAGNTTWQALTGTGATGGGLLPSDFFDITVVMRPASTVGANGVFRFGLVDTLPADTALTAPTNGVYVEKLTADTQYFGVCRNGGTQTRTAAFGTVTINTWTKFRIRRVDASTIGFTQDAGAEVLVTTNIPTASIFPVIHNAGIAAAGTTDWDLYDIAVNSLTR